jgi:hypothetical protein
MNQSIRQPLAAVAAGCALVVSLGACGSSSGGAPAAAPASSPSATSAPLVLASPPSSASGAPTLTAQQVSDSGLASKVGAGKLSKPTIKRLIQFFETKVSRAYATGNADALDHYLAGPMLSGNRATINLLTSKHKRNVYRIRVETVKPQTNEAHHLIVNMTGDMTLNYFFNPSTKKVLDNGLPGPSQVQFVIFLDQNPSTHTWYWTGEKSNVSSGSGNGTTTSTVG